MFKRNRNLAYVLGVLLTVPALTLAGQGDSGNASTEQQSASDQAITAAVKTRLAATRVDSFTSLDVEANDDGTVWLSGTTPTQEAAERAVEIARNADGVMLVKSRISVAEAGK